MIQVSHAVATALNASLVILRAFKENEEVSTRLKNLFANAAEEERDVGADEVQSILDGAENAVDNLDKTIEEKSNEEIAADAAEDGQNAPS